MQKTSADAKSQGTSYDVVVIGGGPAGVVAAVQAARAGMRTLLVEKSGMLGGTTTIGGVNFPGLFHAWGRQVIAGIGWEWVTTTVSESGGRLPDFSRWREVPHWQLQIPVNIPLHATIADRLLKMAGADILFHSMLAGLEFVTDQQGPGRWYIDLCLKEGLTRMDSKIVIDCSGDANAVTQAGFAVTRNEQLQPGTLVMRTSGYDMEKLDLAALEGAFLEAVDHGEMKRSDFQAAHSPVTSFLKGKGRNSVHIPQIDASTSRGKTLAELSGREAMLRIVQFLRAKPGLGNFKIDWCAPECGIRETVTISGELCITHHDYTAGRIWPDSLCYSYYPIDLHNPAGKGGIDTRALTEGICPTIPLRAMLPQRSQSLIVAGRCVCGDQLANSAFRVQASAMAMGQVAGAVAAIAVKLNVDVRDVPLVDVREMLIRNLAIVPPVSTEDIGCRRSAYNSICHGNRQIA